ncbi:hypothetical protein ACLOJK_015650 [Asimina triloba]
MKNSYDLYIIKNGIAFPKQLQKKQLCSMERSGLSVVTVCPSLTLGPLLQSTYQTGKEETVENRARAFVDVRDVAEAVIMVYEKPEASGRYICAPHMISMRDLVDKLRSMYPNYNYPKKFEDTNDQMLVSSEKLKSLGWKYRPLEETLADTVQCFQESGLVNKV